MHIDPDRIQELVSEQGWYFEPAAANALYFVPPTNEPSRNYCTRWTPVTILLPEYMNAPSKEVGIQNPSKEDPKEEGCLIKGKVIYFPSSTLTQEEIQGLEKLKEVLPKTFKFLLEGGIIDGAREASDSLPTR